VSAQPTVPVNEPLLDGNEEAYLLECIRSGWISSEGPFVARFEEAFAHHAGRRHAIAVTNGSAALELAVAALGIGPGDEVILPTFTIISCAAAVVRAGAVPVLVDCDPATWTMRVDEVAARITGRTRAIMAVHIYGLPVDMDPLLELARRHGLLVIEDAAEAVGQTYRGRACGGFGEIGAFSFYANKHVTTGEGGMLVTDDEALAARCRSLRNLAFAPGRRFVHEELGWNLRMTSMQAAIGLAQLERLPATIERKRAIGARYQQRLAPLSGIDQPVARTPYADNDYWVFGVVLREAVPLDAEAAMRRLAADGIGTRPFFWPLHEQPVFRKQGLFAGESHPAAERLARRGFYLPSGVALTAAQVDLACSAVERILS
jgi:perosamine synthetase